MLFPVRDESLIRYGRGLYVFPVRETISIENGMAQAMYFPVRETISIENGMGAGYVFPRQGNHINRKTCIDTRIKTPYGVSHHESPAEIGGCFPL
jgi:hypothetical protein